MARENTEITLLNMTQGRWIVLIKQSVDIRIVGIFLRNITIEFLLFAFVRDAIYRDNVYRSSLHLILRTQYGLSISTRYTRVFLRKLKGNAYLDWSQPDFVDEKKRQKRAVDWIRRRSIVFLRSASILPKVSIRWRALWVLKILIAIPVVA